MTLNKRLSKKNFKRPRGRGNLQSGSFNQTFSDFNNFKNSLFLKDIDEAVPERMLVKLSATDDRLAKTLNTGTAINWSIVSGAYAIYSGGQSLVGFPTLMGLYSSYRVHHVKIRAHISNQETNKNLTVCICPTLAGYSDNSLTVDQIQNLQNNPWAKTFLLQPSPYGKCTLTSVTSTRAITGNDSYLFEDNWAGSDSSNPTNLWYWNFAVYPNSGTLTTALGVALNVKVTMYLELLKRDQIVNIDRYFLRLKKLDRMIDKETSIMQ